jgi:hypothetical protein
VNRPVKDAPESDAPGEDVVDGEGFLRRWSRRKHHAPVAAEPAAAPQPESPPAPIDNKRDEDMPPLEELDENSDFSGFLSEGVSEKLRKAALRRLFHLPGFNVTDGLDDYDEDFTNFELLGDIVTCDMRHQAEMEQEREQERLAREQELVEADETGDSAPRPGGEASVDSHAAGDALVEDRQGDEDPAQCQEDDEEMG